MQKSTWSNYKRSGIWVDPPPPCFFKIPTFSRYFFWGASLNHKVYIALFFLFFYMLLGITFDYNNQEEICPLGHEWLSSIASSVEDRIITHHWAALILVLGSKERSWKQSLHQNVGQILLKHTKRIYLDLTKLKPIKCVVSGSNVCWPSLIPRSILIDQTFWTLHFPVHFSTTGHCSITMY